MLLKIEEWYKNKNNNFFIALGGVNKTFILESKTFTFAIFIPSKYNINFYVFEKVKKFSAFKQFFRLLLVLPYFFTENIVGKFCMSLIILWSAVGREPLTAIFCFSFVVEFFTFLIYMSYFLHLEGVYQYCIDTYGKAFVEKYI